MANGFILKPLPLAAVSVTSIGGGAAENVGNDFAGIVWRSGTGDGHGMVIDLGTNVTIDTIMVFGIEGTSLSTASVTIQLARAAQGSGFNGSNTGSGTGTGNYWGESIAALAGAVLPVSGKGVTLWQRPAENGPPTTNRYVAIYYSGLGGSGWVQAARVVIGARIQPRRNFSFGWTRGVVDLGKLEYSARGALLRRRAAKLRTVMLTYSSIYRDEAEGWTARLMEEIGNTEMIAVVTDPDPNDERQSRCFFGPHVGDITHVQRSAAAWEVKFNVVSRF